MGKLLGVPASFVSRHPFPGPGLAVRILGDVTQDNALETIRLVRLEELTRVFMSLRLQLNLVDSGTVILTMDRIMDYAMWTFSECVIDLEHFVAG